MMPAKTPAKNTRKAASTKRTPRAQAKSAPQPPENVARMIRVLAGASRARIAQQLGIQYGGDRDIHAALGYKDDPVYADFRARYRRQDMAKAVIDRPVNGVWRKPPTIIESEERDTPFEAAWEEIEKRLRIWYYLERTDRLACLGEFAVLLLGFDGTGELETEITGARQLLYLMPYGQSSVTINKEVTDSKDERFGLPELYKIKMGSGGTGMEKLVHWSRVIHVAFGNLESETLGTPELEVVFDRLFDLEKVAGGSAEMFWRGAFPGLGVSAHEDAEFGEQSLAALTTELEEYQHDLKRYLRLQGVDLKQLAPQVADPSKHIDTIISLIAAAKNIPKRVLLGQEESQLAGQQDERAWLDYVDWRREQVVTPTLIDPLINRLISVRLLPEPKDGYKALWPDLMVKSDKDVAETGGMRTKALRDYSDSIGADTVVGPREFLIHFLGYDEATADQMLSQSIEDNDRANADDAQADDEGAQA